MSACVVENWTSFEGAAATIEIVVLPSPARKLGVAGDGATERRNLTRGFDSDFSPVRQPQIEKFGIDLRRRGSDRRRETGRRQQLTVDESRVVDGEEHAAQAARLQYLDVDSLWEHRYLSTADQPLLSRLREQRLSDR